MKDRIKKIMESQHMTQQVFASFIEMSPATLSSIFNDRTKPTLNMVEAIKRKIPNLSTDWLMFGIGSMYLDSASATDAGSASAVPESGERMLNFDDVQPTPSTAPAVTFSDTPRVSPTINTVKIIDKKQRSITEIRIFYDDQTWETFVPKK